MVDGVDGTVAVRLVPESYLDWMQMSTDERNCYEVDVSYLWIATMRTKERR